MIKLTRTQKSSLSSSSFLRLARKARPVAVAKAPKAIPNDEFSSPVLGSAWLPRLWLGSFTSEVDSDALIEADTEALVDAEAERLADVLNEVEILVEVLVLSEALKNADLDADSDALADSDAETEADVLADSDADTLALCTSLNDTDSLAEIEALTEADCDSLNETLNDADSDSETLDDVLIESEAMTLSISRLSSDRMAG